MSDIKIIFDQSDLHIQENLNPKDLKIIFGYEDQALPSNCPPSEWVDKDGDNVNIDCGCINRWEDKDGDNIGVEYDCGTGNNCDSSWNDTNDFNCECNDNWNNNSDFNIDCSGGGGSKTSDLGTVRSYDGQSASFLIYGLEIYTGQEGQESNVVFDTRQTVLSNLNVYDGQSINNVLSANRYATASYTIGETLLPTVTYAPVANFVIDIYEGQEVPIILNGDTKLEYKIYDGQSSSVVINTYQGIPLSFDLYDGQYTNTSLDIIKGFIVRSYDGTEIRADVFTPETGRMDYNVYEGQSVELDLALTRSLSFDSNFGNNSDFNISPNYDWSTNGYDGQSVNITFYKPQTAQLAVNVLDGHYLRIPSINLDTGFIIDAYEGQNVNTVIEYDPYQGLPALMHSGETMVFQLNSIHEIHDISNYDGQSVSTSINTYESFRMSVNAYDGQNVNTKPMFTIILGTSNAYDGTTLKVTTMDETPNTNMYTGEDFVFDLSTSLLMNVDYFDGQNTKFELKRGEPVTLGTITAYEGTQSIVDLKILVSTSFSIHYKWGNEIFFNEWSNSPYHIDLGKRKCCVGFDNDIKNIELNDAPYNSTSYDQYGSPCESMTFELSTRRTMSFNVHEGQYSEFDPTKNTLEVRVHEGQYVYSRDVVTEMWIDLEDGNLIPEYNDVTIELNRPVIASDRKYYRMYSGDNVSFKLGVPYAFYPTKFSGGDRVEINLIVDPALKINCYFGGGANCVLSTNVQIPTKVYEGQQTKITVYEDPYLHYVGEECYFELETKSDYYAEFVDTGCLDNQYQETGEDGQPLPSTFNGTNVEGERFLNFVEGRCF